MIIRRAFCGLISFWAVTIAAYGAPSVLIVQFRVPLNRDNSDPNVMIGDYIAQECDTDGRVTPIVYSITDPIFRAAANDGRLKDVPSRPTLADAFDVARRLKAEYVLGIEAAYQGKVLRSKAKLYRNKQAIWKDDQNLSVSTQQVINKDETSGSIARTMVLRMSVGPFKGFPSQKKTLTPDLSPGQGPVAVEPAPAVSVPLDNTRLKHDTDALIESGKRSAAVLLLRDAVDSSPFDVERRIALIEVMLAENPEAAAMEARRAAGLMPEKGELRVIAARAWMQAGRPEEAQKDLNEAVARDPNGTSTRILLGELSLEELAPDRALDHLDQAIKKEDSPRARFLRAVCRALLGGVDGMQLDLVALGKLDPQPSQSALLERYNFAADINDRLAARDATNIRSFTQRIVVKPHDKALLDEIEQEARLLQSRTALLGALTVPAPLKQSQDRRLLANRLLAQCLVDLDQFSEKGDEDALADARINLTEALKQASLNKVTR